VKEQVFNLIFALQERLAAKQPMYEADEEWRDISAAIAALYVLVRKGWAKW
jgi:acyl carrier protein